MDRPWELFFVFVEQCFNKVALRSSNLEMKLSSGSVLLSTTEKVKRRVPKRSKNVTLFNAILLFPNPWSEVLILWKISEIIFENATLARNMGNALV